jgi:hypothetical protein
MSRHVVQASSEVKTIILQNVANSIAGTSNVGVIDEYDSEHEHEA